MIYIGNHAENGCGIYLDMYSSLRRRSDQEISAIIGDGFYEGEVLIQIGTQVEVTFVDALWGNAGALKGFFERHGEDKIRADITSVVTGRMTPSAVPGGRPLQKPHVFLPVVQEEMAARWGR